MGPGSALASRACPGRRRRISLAPFRVPDSSSYNRAHVRVLATTNARGLHQLCPSRLEEGAGKAGCRLHPWAPCNKKHGGRATGSTGNIPAFPARWFTAYFALSPVTGLLPPSSLRSLLLAKLSASTGAPGPHDFAVREHLAFVFASAASTASHRAFVTLRNAPLIG